MEKINSAFNKYFKFMYNCLKKLISSVISKGRNNNYLIYTCENIRSKGLLKKRTTYEIVEKNMYKK